MQPLPSLNANEATPRQVLGPGGGVAPVALSAAPFVPLGAFVAWGWWTTFVQPTPGAELQGLSELIAILFAGAFALLAGGHALGMVLARGGRRVGLALAALTSAPPAALLTLVAFDQASYGHPLWLTSWWCRPAVSPAWCSLAAACRRSPSGGPRRTREVAAAQELLAPSEVVGPRSKPSDAALLAERISAARRSCRLPRREHSRDNESMVGPVTTFDFPSPVGDVRRRPATPIR